MSDDYIYSERSYDTQPFTRPEIIFINDDLIPFYNNMIDRYSPDAIVLVTVKKCPSLQELETNSYELLKGVRSCLMRTDKGLVLQSMMSEYRNLTIPIRRITSLTFDPENIYYLDDPGTDDPNDLRFKIKLDYIADPTNPVTPKVLSYIRSVTTAGVIRNMQNYLIRSHSCQSFIG